MVWETYQSHVRGWLGCMKQFSGSVSRGILRRVWCIHPFCWYNVIYSMCVLAHCMLYIYLVLLFSSAWNQHEVYLFQWIVDTNIPTPNDHAVQMVCNKKTCFWLGNFQLQNGHLVNWFFFLESPDGCLLPVSHQHLAVRTNWHFWHWH